MKILTILKKLARDSSGVTLVEMLVVVSIMSIGLALVGTTVFQSLAIEKYWHEEVVATRELRHAGSYFAGDALRAESVSLLDSSPPEDNVTIQWIDGAGNPHTAFYSLTGDNLVRQIDGVQIIVARRVVSLGFSLNARTLTLDLEVQAEQGTTESISLDTYLRYL
jgi:prepilin-type N-terminal cleavage/methylation domain-containing protein